MVIFPDVRRRWIHPNHALAPVHVQPVSYYEHVRPSYIAGAARPCDRIDMKLNLHRQEVVKRIGVTVSTHTAQAICKHADRQGTRGGRIGPELTWNTNDTGTHVQTGWNARTSHQSRKPSSALTIIGRYGTVYRIHVGPKNFSRNYCYTCFPTSPTPTSFNPYECQSNPPHS
jgi:hypothetical protein